MPLPALALAALLTAGCGDILHEIDGANDLAGKPTGSRPAGAPSQAPPAAAAESGPAALLARMKGWVGLAEEPNGQRRPRDPNDPMVTCRVEGSTRFMLKSGCIAQQGTVVATKGVPH